MNRDLTPGHDRVEELIVADVLGGLDMADRGELEATLTEHGPDCEECARLLAEYTEAAAGLALALDPAPLSADAEDRLIGAARANANDGPALRLVALTGEARDGGTGAASPAVVSRTRRWLAAAAVAACFAVGGALFGYSLAPRAPGGTSSFLAFVAQPNTRVAAFPSAGQAALAVAYRPGQRQAWIVGSSLQKPSGGRTYELWYQTDPQGPMRRAGLFQPVHGDVVARVAIGPDVQALAVSIEPPGGSDAPTTTPVFITTV